MELPANLTGIEVAPSAFFNMLEVSDFNIWNYGLTEDQMIQWTSCKALTIKGNVVNWDIATWIVPESAFEIYEINDVNSMCSQESVGSTVFPEKFNAHEALSLCHQVNGDMFLIKDNKTRQSAERLINRTECCNLTFTSNFMRK